MTTTIATIATIVEHTLDMDPYAAKDILETYIQQMGEAAGRTIDPDDITPEDTEFLIESVKSAHAAGDLGQKELFALEEIVTEYDKAASTADALRQQRNAAIRAAIAAGARRPDVTAIAGVSRTAMGTIIRGE